MVFTVLLDMLSCSHILPGKHIILARLVHHCLYAWDYGGVDHQHEQLRVMDENVVGERRIQSKKELRSLRYCDIISHCWVMECITPSKLWLGKITGPKQWIL